MIKGNVRVLVKRASKVQSVESGLGDKITKGGFIMKKIAIEILIAAATVMAYVLPVLAEGGGC